MGSVPQTQILYGENLAHECTFSFPNHSCRFFRKRRLTMSAAKLIKRVMTIKIAAMAKATLEFSLFLGVYIQSHRQCSARVGQSVL